MYIQNVGSQVPSNIRSVFDSYIPFGSDFVYYCLDNSYGNNTYVAIYRKIGSSSISRVMAQRSSDGFYTFTQTDDIAGDWSTVSLSHPEYGYSNMTGVGQYYDLPSGNTLLTVCIVVLASLAVLKTVFGGIRWIHSKRYRV